MDINHLTGNFEEDLKITEILLGEHKLLETTRLDIRQAFLNLYKDYDDNKFEKFFNNNILFVLVCGSKEMHFTSLRRRHSYILDNNINKGKCYNFKAGKKTDSYSFSHSYL